MDMADIIAEHDFLTMSLSCLCGNWAWPDGARSKVDPHASHVAEELAKAGYGNVQETKAEVWNEAYWTGVQDQMDAADHSSDDFGIPGGFPVRPARVNPYHIEAA